MKVAVVGQSGSKECQPRLRADMFTFMVDTLMEMKGLCQTDTLLSGGAAWADHAAVVLFNKRRVKDLHLYLPCEWDDKAKRFADNGHYSYSSNPGKLANHLHMLFSEKCRRDSLRDIQRALDDGATYEVHDGFRSRNRELARNCDRMVCFTQSPVDRPISGGSFHVWNQCQKPKEHINLK